VHATTARLGKLTVGGNYPVAVMGIINRDPNSFFRGSYYHTQKLAIAAVELMQAEQVDILDVGGASTAPGAAPVSGQVERERIVSLIKELASRWDTPISIDTQRSNVASQAIRNGASVVNDVSGLKSDSNMANTISDAGASAVVMACSRQPGDCHTMSAISEALRESVAIALKAGISVENVVVDPGIGFGKPTACDLAILRDLPELCVLRRPILVSPSRKTFIGRVLGYPSPEPRLAGTLAAVTFALLQGANVIRSHDVQETRDCIRMVDAIQSNRECET
jgi:dihydropteroate synthase